MAKSMNENCYALFRSRFPRDLGAIFIEPEQGAALSFAELESVSGRFARLFERLGIKPGDRVAVQVEKSPEALFLYVACLRYGAIFLPMNTAYQRGEVDYILGDAAPALFVCRPEAETEAKAIAGSRKVAHVLSLGQKGDGSLMREAAGLEPRLAIHELGPDDIACILYTSGTTGRPKGAMLSHRNLASNTVALHQVWQFQPGDVLLHALPIFHAHGLFVATNLSLYNGSRMLFLPRFDAEAVIRLLPRATVFMGVPTY